MRLRQFGETSYRMILFVFFWYLRNQSGDRLCCDSACLTPGRRPLRRGTPVMGFLMQILCEKGVLAGRDPPPQMRGGDPRSRLPEYPLYPEFCSKTFPYPLHCFRHCQPLTKIIENGPVPPPILTDHGLSRSVGSPSFSPASFLFLEPLPGPLTGY